ncbi:MAG TPA: hypothetical protein ENK57_26595 [Polyangiaceae bacterium]|nr:hypothetical protein [Polyangiaceae bacterium]
MNAIAGAAMLPGPGDTEALMPPALVVHVRRVRGENLWVWYTATDQRLIVRTLTAQPPVPLDW